MASRPKKTKKYERVGDAEKRRRDEVVLKTAAMVAIHLANHPDAETIILKLLDEHKALERHADNLELQLALVQDFVQNYSKLTS